MTGPTEDRPLLSELWHSRAWRLFPLLLAYMAGELINFILAACLAGPTLPPPPLPLAAARPEHMP